MTRGLLPYSKLGVSSMLLTIHQNTDFLCRCVTLNPWCSVLGESQRSLLQKPFVRIVSNMHPAVVISNRKKGEWFEATCSFCKGKGECEDDCAMAIEEAAAQAQLAAAKKAGDSATSGSSGKKGMCARLSGTYD